MNFRFALVISSVCAFMWSPTALANHPVPTALQSQFEGDQLVLEDLNWMAGNFSDSDDEQREQFIAIEEWLEGCGKEKLEIAKLSFVERGIDANMLTSSDVESLECRQVRGVISMIKRGNFKSYQELRKTEESIRPRVETFMAVLKAAELTSARIHQSSLRDKLLTRALGEQILRKGMNWGRGDYAEAAPITDNERAVLQAHLLTATHIRDHWNTNWLKGILDKEGWPKASVVGADASKEAWLLAQHADHDPLFQLQVLTYMSEAVAVQEANPNDYAYLYDRVMLNLTGRQRYATQLPCSKGTRTPDNLEDPGSVNELRAEVGLPPLESYIAQMNERFGECSPDI